ncbi:MAG: hypothetical protein K2P45_07410 [Eubacterium sp.]|nr:hypothetical protein [Eubacterium sp.]
MTDTVWHKLRVAFQDKKVLRYLFIAVCTSVIFSIISRNLYLGKQQPSKITITAKDSGEPITFRGASVDGYWCHPADITIQSEGWLYDSAEAVYTNNGGQPLEIKLPFGEKRALTFNSGPKEGTVLVEAEDEVFEFNLWNEQEVEKGLPYLLSNNSIHKINRRLLYIDILFFMGLLVILILFGNKIINKTSQLVRQKATGVFISFLLALVFSMAVFTATNPIWGYTGVDSACFLLMGRGMLDGRVPYRDLVDNKGLVLYFLNALGQFLFQFASAPAFGVWVIEFLCLFFSLLLVRSFAGLFGCQSMVSVLMQVLYLAAIFPLIEMGNVGEEYTCFFTLLGFRLCARYLVENRTDCFWRYGFGAGILFALCFFVRPNNALPLAGMIFVLGMYFLFRKEWRNLFISVGTFGIGIAGVVMPMAAYLTVNDALYDCISQTFLANMNYFEDSGNSFLGLLHMPYGHKAVIYMLICFFGVYIALVIYRKSDSFRIFALGILVGACFSFYSAFLSGFAYLHYLLVCIPGFLISILLAVSTVDKTQPGECGRNMTDSRVKLTMQIIYVLPVLLCLLVFASESPVSFWGNLKGCPSAVTGYLREGNYRTNQMLDVAAQIPKQEKNEVYILEEGEAKSTDLYMQTGLYPYKRIFICGDRFARVLPKLQEEYVTYFTTEKPKWLILAIPLDHLQLQEQKSMIEDAYVQVFANAYGVSLYRLQEKQKG